MKAGEVLRDGVYHVSTRQFPPDEAQKTRREVVHPSDFARAANAEMASRRTTHTAPKRKKRKKNK